ncbi:DUF58 domain-containing protein [Candidatus Sumerlaeota bacterium]|nr:DUF58 domain-containing protein [Candidatus Sumerlaeota bacterium]MBI3737336.1 DUF58 domain-containing protein [Candidatus Sumerlaeota bacterium]
MAEPLLNAQFLRQLDRLELQTRRILGGQIKGERRSRKKGVSIDFADYRHYTRGDDLRFIDWNIYGRLDRLFIKIFYEEQDLQCHILLDTSKSMDFGEPNKMDFAKRAAASIAYIGLGNHDKIGITCFHGKVSDQFRPTRGQHQIRRMLGFLDQCKPDGQTSLQAVCRDFSLRAGARGIVTVISDFLDPAGFEPALRYLIRDNLDVYVLHLLSPQEIEPQIGGHVELHDIETGHKVDLTVNARLKDVYMRNVAAYCSQIQEYCTHYGMSYSLIRSDTTLEDLTLKRLRETGLVKA